MITLAHSLVTYHVSGLEPDSCPHCVSAMKAALAQLPDVVGVDVNQTAGKVSLLTEGMVEESFVVAAIEDSGCVVDRVPRWTT
ncbi:heavy-metal-associated domain-containing protein [Nonomuraea sp. NPDC050663]|uniref:heavy-metal-associated domain-containing protein n=1 Tax=Nonomuraea sp. NPDC050663 TaxID=3364370 RepID=UPI0037948761